MSTTQKAPITAKGHTQLVQELTHLKKVKRPEIIQAIAKARELGDLSENADYQAAKEDQKLADRRIAYLEKQLAGSIVVEPGSVDQASVNFGASVTIVDEETEQERVLRIVGEDEANIKEGLLSISAPLARALLKKAEGASIEFNTPSGTKYYTVLRIRY